MPKRLLRYVRGETFAALRDRGSAILFAGITSTDRLVRRRQMFTNILAGVVALNALFHFMSNAAHDFDELMLVNLYNAVMFAFCLANHRLHAQGDRVAAVTLLSGILVGHTFVVAAFGTASSLHVYFTLAGFILFLVGVENFRLFAVFAAFTFAALIGSLAFVPEYGFVAPADIALRHDLAFESLMNAFIMNALLTTIALAALHRAEERSESLLTAVLPARIAERLKTSQTRRIADRVETCSVLFLDLVGFTEATNELEPEIVVAHLDRLYSRFDAACERLGADKIKTIGDSYLAVGGLEGDGEAGARAIGALALELRDLIDAAPPLGRTRLRMRAGIHSGPVTAGVIGDIRMTYDVWGETVNTASRMESHGLPGHIHVSEAFYRLARNDFVFEPRGTIAVKSLGQRNTHFLVAHLPAAALASPAA